MASTIQVVCVGNAGRFVAISIRTIVFPIDQVLVRFVKIDVVVDFSQSQRRCHQVHREFAVALLRWIFRA